MKKGQTAMEYLMTYGWAILIILIVGGLLVFYGVFSIRPGASKQGFGLLDVTSPWDYKANGSLVLRMENRVGQSVTLGNLWLSNPATATASLGDTGNFSNLTSIVLSPGQTSDFQQTVINIASGGNTGDAYSIRLIVEYTVGSTKFNSTGTLGGTRS